MTDHTGRQLGNYRLLRKLGSGGFATVYLAEHVYLNTQVAVKVLGANLASVDLQNFQKEAQVIAHLEHSHIVRVRDFGVESNVQPYLVMEYAPNGTLRQRHSKGTQVALPLVGTYVKQLASALQYAHGQRLIHRDVKPENVLLGRNNELLLGDFGAALVTRTTIMLGPQNVIGTISYMAPEQLQGHPVPASDQYALAVMTYEWLCGYCPFEGLPPAALAYRQINDSPPSLRARIPTLSLEVEQVVMRALATKPEQRYRLIGDFAVALEQAANRRVQDVPLILRGNGDMAGRNYAPTALAAETMVASPQPQPAPIAPSLPVTPLPPTIRANVTLTPEPFRPLAPAPRVSRRKMIGALAGVGIASGVGMLTWGLAHLPPPSTVTPTPTPKPKATPVPTKSNAFFTYREDQEQIYTAAWSPDDALIASSGGNTADREGNNNVYVWNAKTGQDRFTYSGHSRVVRMVAWSPNGKLIASAGEDMTVQVWDTTIDPGNKPLIRYVDHGNSMVMAAAWSPHGERIASISLDHNALVWDVGTGQTIGSYPGQNASPGSAKQACIAWSPKGTFIASTTTNNTVDIWNPETGERQYRFPGNTMVGALAWSHDGRYLAIGYYNPVDNVKIYDINTGTFVVLPGTNGDLVYALSWSPDGKHIAVGYDWGEVKIWRYDTREQVLIYQGHNTSYPQHYPDVPYHPIMSVQWSHNGNYVVSSSFDQTVQIWTPSP